MTAAAFSWTVLAVWITVLAIRATLTETVWLTTRDERTPRRVLRGLEIALVALTLALVAGLAFVVAPSVTG